MLTHDLDALSQTLAESFPEPFGEETDGARFQETILRLLAEGSPVPVETIASATGQAASEVERVLGAGGAEMDEQGRLVGLGLTIRETPHRFAVGGRSLYTWCALDTLIYPAVLGRAQVESPCRATGTPIRVEITAAGVERVEPAEAVVSIVRPRPGLPIRASFCNDVHFFRSADAAAPWLSRHPGAIVLPVADAFELGARLAASLYPGVNAPS